MNKQGVIGVGTIGGICVERLVKAGRPVVAFDPSEAAQQRIRELGATVADGAAGVLRQCDVVLLCLPGAKHVEAVVTGMLPAVRPGQLIIDTSTCRPETETRCEQLVRQKGAAWVDSPLTRRADGFVFMVGASQEDYGRAAETLSIVGARHRLLGPVGAGQTAKLMQQMLSAMEKASRLEVAAFGRRAGLDPAFLKDYLGFGLTDKLLAEEPGSAATLQMMYKDLGYYLDVAHENGAAVPIGSIVREIFKTSTRVSDGTWGHDGIHAYYRLQNAQPLDVAKSPVVTRPGPLWEKKPQQ